MNLIIISVSSSIIITIVSIYGKYPSIVYISNLYRVILLDILPYNPYLTIIGAYFLI